MNLCCRLANAVAVLIVLTLSACQTVPQNADDGFSKFNQADFVSQYQQRAKISAWSLKGAFGFANSTENVQGKVFWSQADGNAQIHLLGPLGAGSVKLNLNPNFAVMQQGNKTYTETSADRLMLKVLGWKMPIGSLNYWLFGLADPRYKARYRLGENGEIVELKQSGWLIRFKQYKQDEGFTLPMPRKIFASHEKTDTDVRLVVKSLSR